MNNRIDYAAKCVSFSNSFSSSPNLQKRMIYLLITKVYRRVRHARQCHLTDTSIKLTASTRSRYTHRLYIAVYIVLTLSHFSSLSLLPPPSLSLSLSRSRAPIQACGVWKDPLHACFPTVPGGIRDIYAWQRQREPSIFQIRRILFGTKLGPYS